MSDMFSVSSERLDDDLGVVVLSGEVGSSLRNLVKASNAVLVSPALMATVAISKNDCASIGRSAVICP
jgi:hypothetical protein